MPEPLYTVEETAEYLKLKLRTVRAFLTAGKIKGVKVGREWRVPESDLQAYIDGLKAARDSKPE
jgi:excisionase family DNA binding protein